MEQYSKKVDWLLKVYWECEKDVEYILNMYSQTSGLPFCERNLFEDICDLNAPVEDPGFAGRGICNRDGHALRRTVSENRG